jgi:uncharacterized protein
MAQLRIEVLDTLANVSPQAWNALVDGHPFLRHEFLHALHETKAACIDTGWQPQFLAAWRGIELVGAMPLYLKYHSRGEYVFDWAWADAYERHGLSYYPKLLAAIPFSPVSAPKILAADATVRARLAAAALEAAQQVSSLHVLFPTETEEALFTDHSMMVRRGVQFHWTNDNYRDFDDFLVRLSHDKRKKIKQERRKVLEAGIVFTRKTGAEISAADWAFFNKCYRTTYRAHHSSPYLNLAFFERLGATMPEHMLLVIGSREGVPVCAALNIFTPEILYGRYWGTLEFASGLHFEACYYQAIEFCIERGIRTFEGGAQGEHKLARGFLPVAIRSTHWLKQPEFSDAVERFLARESKGVHNYIDELTEHSPYRQGAAGV